MRIHQLQAYLADHPGDRFAMYALALELKKAGDPTAEAAFRALLALHPLAGAGWLQLGGLLADQGRSSDAIAVYDAGIAALVGATDADSRRSRGELTAARDQLDDSDGSL